MRHSIIDHDGSVNKISRRQALCFIALEQFKGTVHIFPCNGQDIDLQRFNISAYREPCFALLDHYITIEYLLQHLSIDYRGTITAESPLFRYCDNNLRAGRFEWMVLAPRVHEYAGVDEDAVFHPACPFMTDR